MDDRIARVVAGTFIRRLSRRRLLQFAALGALSPLVACGDGDQAATPGDASSPSAADRDGSPVDSLEALTGTSKLVARPVDHPPAAEVTIGIQSLGAGHPEDAVLYVPPSYSPQSPAPLAVLFHGAGGGVSGVINAFQGRAEANGIILLATKSRDVSWDITVTGEFGADIAFLDDALADVFSRFAVDPAHVALAGFSDGASYALAVGLRNGSLVTDIIAFSPGFLTFGEIEGEPRIFISHGMQDVVLPIDQTSRKIVPQLRQAGYEVEYVEFDGLHMVPDDILDAAVDWWLH